MSQLHQVQWKRRGGALLGALGHTLGTWAAIMAVWAIWLAWNVFVQGDFAFDWRTPPEVYRFGLSIALLFSLPLSGEFLILSFVYRLFKPTITGRQVFLSSFTLALSSLLLVPFLPEGGLPLLMMIIVLPLLATLWLNGKNQRLKLSQG
ncbi:hypothetical protein ATHL_03358 [Anaerolinea thermolimosa]|uniref:Uncharacterized protein n=1 Tax=Anaerolinea thermolimosa TaxID=229919 RepID=A0A7U9KM88_9CHLR|nr:hypothetical protein [Anaerolinea thermolimosa]GAP08454.1 hypothetical protein ATHL_03358 [Anaerolinea thermolimosa]